ncbi:MAG: TIGR00730 family Rossman fold protein [Acidimicrobiia bacterium]
MSGSLGAVSVYCGSNPGTDPAYAEAAVAIGTELGRRGIDMVYGGGHVGLMGIAADAALAAGGRVHGVITHALQAREVEHIGLTSLAIVETMHERKFAMADRSDAFVMLPGGFGTLDEFFEVVTWSQLGVHAKPAGILDVGGFFDLLLAFLDHATAEGFIRPQHRDLIVVDPDAASLLDRLASTTVPTVEKVIGRDQR